MTTISYFQDGKLVTEKLPDLSPIEKIKARYTPFVDPHPKKIKSHLFEYLETKFKV